MYHPVGIALADIDVECHLLHWDALFRDLINELERSFIVAVWSTLARVLSGIVHEIHVCQRILISHNSASRLCEVMRLIRNQRVVCHTLRHWI